MSRTPQAATALSLQGVSKRYGAHTALQDVSLAVPSGQLFGLIGHNGAGKSTLFKLVLGLIAPSAGQIEVAGVDVQRGAFRQARRHLGYLPEHLVLYDNLSGLETLRFFAQLKGASPAQIEPLLERVGLRDARTRPVREYSKGMRQRLGFAQALLGQPKLLLLDEPTSGLDPLATREFYEALTALRDQGTTVVISSHVLAELQERVDALAIFARGQLLAQGSVQALRERAGAPLRVGVRGTPQALAAARSAAAALPGVAEHAASADALQWLCPREHKMALMAALAPLTAQGLADIDIHDAPLEQVYFGLQAHTEGAA